MEKLKATEELLSYLGSRDIKLWVEGDRLKFNAPKGALTPELRSQITERKTEIIKFLHQKNLTSKDASFQVTQRLVIKDRVRDSTIWDSVKPQKTDIVIASCYKSGTTLTQQIVNLIINGHDDFESIHKLSPWVEEVRGAREKIELIKNLPGTRIFKTHLPFNALPYYVEWKYIYLVRDGRDVGVSLYEQRRSRIVNPIQDEFGEFWDRWVEGEPHWSFWEHIKSWWEVKHLPNVLMVHYNNLIDDKPAEIERIVNFLDLQIDDNIKNKILEQSSLEYMKINAQKFQPAGYFQGQTFINKGKKNRWKKLLTFQQLDGYEKIIYEKLEPECANWVKNGGALI